MTAYNYMDDGYICCSSTSPSIGADRWQERLDLNNSHMVGGHHMLFEKRNWGFNMDSDATHWGTPSTAPTFAIGRRDIVPGSPTHSMGRQLMTSMVCQEPGGNGPLRGAATHIYTYWHSFIGNVPRDPGAHERMEFITLATSPSTRPSFSSDIRTIKDIRTGHTIQKLTLPSPARQAQR